MHGKTTYATFSAATTVEIQMIPAPSQPQTSKRKPPEDGDNNPFGDAGKKKKETKAKRKLEGEEQPGGLVIVRAPSVHPDTNNAPQSSHPKPSSQSSTQPSQPRAASRPPSSQSNLPHTNDPPIHPSKKFKADASTTTARPLAKGKARERQPNTRAEPEVDEDVRRMQSEADTLRRASHAAASEVGTLRMEPFPALRQPAPPSGERIHDASMPLPLQETPQIERNRFMRGETTRPTHRRKSSLSRGKRMTTSFETTGVISQPHTSVSDTTFYKHIDGELPEPSRARQLLIWCSHRAMTEQADASSSKQPQSGSGKDPPPLSVEGAQLLRRVQEKVIRMLAEGRIDTNVYGSEAAEAAGPKRENEQNVKNRAREIKFNAHIQRSKAEEDTWLQITEHYNLHRAQVLAELDKLASAKAKGKQRASEEQIGEWEIDVKALPEHFRGSEGVELARKILSGDASQQSPLSNRLKDLEWTMESLRSLEHSALETTRIAETDLDRRFATLSHALAARTPAIHPSLGPSSASASSSLTSYLPPMLGRPPPTTDPQALLHALALVDASRPQAQVGDTARRARREVQRAAAEAPPGGIAERRLTGVAPPTPRKPPGTPRRATTPGRGR